MSDHYPSGTSVRPIARRIRAAQDTAAGCLLKADADILGAVRASTNNQRRQLEISAASWAARARLLQAADDELETRKAQSRERFTSVPEANDGG